MTETGAALGTGVLRIASASSTFLKTIFGVRRDARERVCNRRELMAPSVARVVACREAGPERSEGAVSAWAGLPPVALQGTMRSAPPPVFCPYWRAA